MNNAEKKADKAARQGKVQHRDEPSQNNKESKKQSPSKGPSPSKSKTPASNMKGEDKVTEHDDFHVGDPDSRGMNNEEKKADKARREGKTGEETNPNKQGETSHGEFKAGDPKSRGMNNAEKKADKAARGGKVQHRDEPSQNKQSKSSPSKNDKSPSKSKSMQPDLDQLKRHESFEAGNPDSRGMNNEEKKADSARRAGKTGPETNPNKQAETSHGTYYAGNPNSRGMNNEEKKADKARREGRMPLNEGPGRANDEKSAMQSIETGTPAQGGQETIPQREKSEMSTGPGGAGQGEGMTPDIKGGGYERYESYEGTAVVSDSVEPAQGTATPMNEVDMYGDEEPALGKERESTLEEEVDVVIQGESGEEDAFGDEDKKNASKSGLEEAKKASRPEKPARQSSRIKQTGGNKRKMQEGRESEGLLVSEDEERVKKASKKSVGPGIEAKA